MGREIRSVIPNWDHPKKEYGDGYQPMHKWSYIESMSEWIKEYELWQSGKHEDQPNDCKHYAEWAGNPPDVYYYFPEWNESDMTWIQVYETVSEGTPVTPPFATEDELIDYLVQHGDFWDQKRRKENRSGMPCQPWKRDQAEKFVKGSGWMPSGVIVDNKMHTGAEIMDLENNSEESKP